jgi:transcriptional regulator with XRE-family HTH domain
MLSEFKEKIRYLREQKELTQRQMAEMLGVSLRSYVSYENGASYPKDPTIYQELAEFYGVTIDFLINEKDQLVTDSLDMYGYRGRIQAQRILNATEVLCASSSLSEEAEMAFFRYMAKIFERAKSLNRQRMGGGASEAQGSATDPPGEE